MANCQSAKAGGLLDSLLIDIGRELGDNAKNALKKACDPSKLSPDKQLQDSLEDMGANLEGLENGFNPFSNCASRCAALL
jgi:hypothetical protein